MPATAVLPLLFALTQAPIELRSGMVITHSARVIPKVYRLSAPITLKGDDITVDFRGATLQGTTPDVDPDMARDTAIIVAGGRNVAIQGARVRGYKVGILARGTHGLTLIGNDLSDNWKPRLFSLVEHESLVDWLTFHHNEHDEWLRYGAAIYLADVAGGAVRGNTVERGMNALLLVRSGGLAIRDNDFSFNSGLGIGLYRSSDDTIVHNRIDYNVRGYSHGWYSRGQDSADLLIYEQSCRNIVADNSLTHGGDGVFLWAGQTTMDSGSGGANDNLLYANDVSYATANGIEATFSRNTIIANHAWGSEYGVWGGYSFASRITGNDFRGNRTGIAIEHGQDNVITANRFTRDSTAIRLWADSIEPSDWGYPRHHDTRSRDYHIAENVFVGNRVALRARQTERLAFRGNRWLDVDSLTVLRDTTGFDVGDNAATRDTSVPRAAPAEGVTRLPTLSGYPVSPLSRRDRSAIIVDDWGPYDWRSPKLWPVPADSTHAVPLHLAVLGPAEGGRWRLVARRGVANLSRTSGRVGDTLVVTPASDSLGDWNITLEYRGAATLSPRGVRRAAGQPYRFSYGRFEPSIDWSVRFFSWADTTNLFAQPIDSGVAARLDFMWYRPPRTWAQLPQERWSLRATGAVDLPPGAFRLRAISDDAVRVWVDGKLVIDAWSPHESRVDEAPIEAGRHELRVEYYQNDGWVELRAEIVRS
ncbi:MAG TPA: NosD domain-containing protein [Gemmatimonadales bacterium]|nr:NosD domain-containing protein [Gemmatimonadales bacterium]